MYGVRACIPMPVEEVTKEVVLETIATSLTCSINYITAASERLAVGAVNKDLNSPDFINR